MSYRYPFTAIASQDDLKLALILAAVDPLIGGVLAFGDRGTGDIPLTLHEGERIANLALGPHARRWQFSKPQQSLRSTPNVDRIATLLAKALAGETVQPELPHTEAARYRFAAAAA